MTEIIGRLQAAGVFAILDGGPGSFLSKLQEAMSGAKKKTSSSMPAWLRIPGAWLLRVGRPLLVAGVLAALCVWGGYWIWQRVRPRVVEWPEYRVGPENVEISSPPSWIHGDLRAETFRDSALEGRLSILDDDLTERIAHAFARHPWVAKVVRVEKRHPSASTPSVRVELEYRKPACMVEVPGGVLPVDAEGVLLPRGDFSPGEVNNYPRLSGAERPPAGPPGRSWGDAAVIGGAEIAAALGPDWKTLQIQGILAAKPPDGALGRSEEPIFMLATPAGTRIHWGYAPRAIHVPGGELSAAEKVDRLCYYLEKHDSFDDSSQPGRVLDVRTMPSRPRAPGN